MSPTRVVSLKFYNQKLNVAAHSFGGWRCVGCRYGLPIRPSSSDAMAGILGLPLREKRPGLESGVFPAVREGREGEKCGRGSVCVG